MISLAFLFMVAVVAAVSFGVLSPENGGDTAREVLFWAILAVFMRLLLIILKDSKSSRGGGRESTRVLSRQQTWSSNLHGLANQRVQALHRTTGNRSRVVPDHPASSARLIARVPRAGLPWQAGPSRSEPLVAHMRHVRSAPGRRHLF